MSFAGLAQGIGLVGNMVSSFIGSRAKKKQIEVQNAADLKAWDISFQILRDQLGVASNRTDTALTEANRDRIRNKMAIQKAAIKARGERSVSAAQLGVSGRRATPGITRGADRLAADALSDADINTEIESTNLVNRFNDAAVNAINNINSHAPVGRDSGGSALFGAIGSGINYYQHLSQNQQDDLISNFNFNTDAVDTSPVILDK